MQRELVTKKLRIITKQQSKNVFNFDTVFKQIVKNYSKVFPFYKKILPRFIIFYPNNTFLMCSLVLLNNFNASKSSFENKIFKNLKVINKKS